uniref:Uncharacterized protein n=1 Tax=Anguilla anguilla TaxID=7936 RepID=A0A0E9PCI0_ANGAN
MLCIGNEEVNIVWINQSKEKAAHRLLISPCCLAIYSFFLLFFMVV